MGPLEERALLAGNVEPNWDNNLGFDRGDLANWYKTYNLTNPANAEAGVIVYPNSLHHEGANNNIPSSFGTFGYATVPTSVNNANLDYATNGLARSITVHPGERIEGYWFLIVGQNTPNTADYGQLTFGPYLVQTITPICSGMGQ